MCKQSKTGFTGCPHVYADGDIEYCTIAIDRFIEYSVIEQEEGNHACDNVEIYWRPLRIPGRCFFCQQQEKDDKEGRTWGQGKARQRPNWLK